MSDPDGSTLDATVDQLSPGVEHISPPAAAGTLDRWQQRLRDAGDPELAGIADDLAELKTQLTGGSINGVVIGALLSRLGQKTTAAAAKADAAIAPQLQQLGATLSSQGARLSGAQFGS